MPTEDATQPLHLLDVNVLLALAWPQHVHHQAAHQWFEAAVPRRFATCAVTEVAFLRLSMNPRVVSTDVQFATASEVLRRVRSLPGHGFITDDSSLAAPRLDLRRLAAGHQVTDLHLANLAALHGAVLVTFDRALTTYLQPDESHHVLLLASRW